MKGDEEERRGEERRREERKAEERRGEESRGEERRGEERRGEVIAIFRSCPWATTRSPLGRVGDSSKFSSCSCLTLLRRN
eukprot:763480-Hanusia_phi.AAC.6